MKQRLTALLLCIVLLLTGGAALAWTCPDCSHDGEGNFCSNCGAKKPDGQDASEMPVSEKTLSSQEVYPYLRVYLTFALGKPAMSESDFASTPDTSNYLAIFEDGVVLLRGTIMKEGEAVGASVLFDGGPSGLTSDDMWKMYVDVLKNLNARLDDRYCGWQIIYCGGSWPRVTSREMADAVMAANGAAPSPVLTPAPIGIDRSGYAKVSVRMYSSPAADPAFLLRTLPINTILRVVSELKDGSGTSWYEVVCDGETGYVLKQLVALGSPATPTPKPTPTPTPRLTPPPTSTPVIINCDGYINVTARMYSSPSTDSTYLLKTLASNTVFHVLSEVKTVSGTSWYEVNCDGETGYVLKQLVTLVNFITPTPTPKPIPTATPASVKIDQEGYISAFSAKMYSRPVFNEQYLINTLSTNTTLRVVSEFKDSSGNRWYYMTYGGENGYISKQLITLGSPATPTPKPTAAPVITATPRPATTCTACDGWGRVKERCFSCWGEGSKDCSSCGGDGKYQCGSCRGVGWSNCTSCWGDGCSRCGGDGKRDCSSCSGNGQKRCSSCSGSGEKRCTYCSGKGYDEKFCSRCGGDGRID